MIRPLLIWIQVQALQDVFRQLLSQANRETMNAGILLLSLEETTLMMKLR